jgi:hypothetical protein
MADIARNIASAAGNADTHVLDTTQVAANMGSVFAPLAGEALHSADKTRVGQHVNRVFKKGSRISLATRDGVRANGAATAAEGASVAAGAEGATVAAGTEAVAEGAGVLSKAGKILGKAVTPLAVVAGAAEAGVAIQKKDGHAAATAVGTTAGFLGTVGISAEVGAAVGTLIPVPVVGTVTGFIAGAAVGIGAAFLGGKAADVIAGDSLHAALNKNKKPVMGAHTARIMQQRTAAANDLQFKGAANATAR